MGFGTSPLGGSPYGFGAPVSAEPPPTRENGPDGLPAAGVKFINPLTRDFEVDEISKQLKQMPVLRQMVLLRVTTELGSATALPEFGITKPRKIGTTFAKDYEGEIRRAFAQETDVDKIMRIDRIEITQVNSGRVQVDLVYTDLRSGTADVVTVNG